MNEHRAISLLIEFSLFVILVVLNWQNPQNISKCFEICLSLRQELAQVARFGGQAQKQGAGRVAQARGRTHARMCHQAGVAMGIGGL